MTAAVNSDDPPMAEPGRRPTGANPGASARTDRPASDDRATPASGAQAGAPEAAATGAKGDRGEDEEEEWRHEPVAPVDESNPLKSLGKAVGDTLTGSGPAAPAPPKR